MSTTDEKKDLGMTADKHVSDSSDADGDIEAHGFDKQRTAKLLRKLDIALLPFLSALYLLSFLDRANIGNAKLADPNDPEGGIEKDLGMEGLDYNVAVSVFFPWYVAAEIPSNLMMKRVRPSIWIPSIMVAWGIVCTLMGIVESYGGLLAARMALGLAEGGLFPGITYYITLWYRRHECGFRMAIFFSAATAAGAFGGLFARAIMEMSGTAGRPGWQWIFIIEGIMTVALALVAFLWMHDYPATAKFLQPDEKEEVQRRLEHDHTALADEFDLKYVKHALLDWKIWVQCFIFIGILTPLYSISIFMPTIVKGLGYSNTDAQLMSVPPYVSACIFCIAGGWYADKMQQRGIFMIGYCCVAMVGYLMLLTNTNHTVNYIGCFLVAAGIYPNVPQAVAWTGNNIGGSIKRGVGIAMQVGFGNLGGVISGFVYRTKDAPEFKQGHGTLLGFTAMALLLSSWLTWYLRRENARRDAEHKPPSEYTAEELYAEREKGDNATFFRFTV